MNQNDTDRSSNSSNPVAEGRMDPMEEWREVYKPAPFVVFLYFITVAPYRALKRKVKSATEQTEGPDAE